jgi:hypothetical protein
MGQGKQMLALLHKHHAMSDRFIAHMLARNLRVEEDVIDYLFNSSEQRLALRSQQPSRTKAALRGPAASWDGAVRCGAMAAIAQAAFCPSRARSTPNG